MRDALVFVTAAVVAYVPGLVLLAAVSVPPGLFMVALAPAASVAVAGVTAVLVAPVGLPFGPVALLAVTAAVGAAAVAVRLARPREVGAFVHGASAASARRQAAPLVVGPRWSPSGSGTPPGPGSRASVRSPPDRRNTT